MKEKIEMEKTREKDNREREGFACKTARYKTHSKRYTKRSNGQKTT
jgi:hypothetical protein